jgi:hypothetical protein
MIIIFRCHLLPRDIFTLNRLRLTKPILKGDVQCI